MPSPAEATVVTSQLLHGWPLPRPSGSKKSRGRVLVVGGSPSTPGAAMLAGLAALRVGAGVLSLAVARSVAGAVAAAVPEAAVTGLAELDGAEPDGALRDQLAGCAVVLVGPGVDSSETALGLVDAVAAAAGDDTQFVLDAYALGVLARSDRLDTLRGRMVLTPNASEAARLLDDLDDADDSDDAAIAREIASRYDAVVSYQDYVSEPSGRSWHVAAGHPGLGTSGSGDVLAGGVTGLLARGSDLVQAACWATYLHAIAGERLAARVGRLGFLARELAAELPIVLTETEA